MALTARQRRRINKKNASHSTGPKTEEGRRAASTNSTTHGLRCTVLPLPGPDAAFLAERVQIYNDFYKPQTPVERDLIEQFATSKVQMERTSLYFESHLDQQTRFAVGKYDEQKVEYVEELKLLLRTEPGKAARALKRTALGCRWMTGRWQRLDTLLATGNGGWSEYEADEAVRLMGSLSEGSEVRYAEVDVLEAYPHVVAVRRDGPDPLLGDPAALGQHNSIMATCREFVELKPELRDYLMGPGDDAPERQASVAYLRARIARELAWLKEEASRLEVKIDGPDRANAV